MGQRRDVSHWNLPSMNWQQSWGMDPLERRSEKYGVVRGRCDACILWRADKKAVPLTDVF